MLNLMKSKATGIDDPYALTCQSQLALIIVAKVQTF